MLKSQIEIMLRKKNIMLLALFMFYSSCSLFYAGVIVSSTDPIIDFTADTDHLSIMYGYSPLNITAKRIDMYNVSTNSSIVIANNISIA